MKVLDKEIKNGYNEILNYKDRPWDDPKNIKMNFGILSLENGQKYEIENDLEKAILLLNGQIDLTWSKQNENSSEAETIKRGSIWEEDPSCLHCSKNVNVKISCKSDSAELAIITTINDTLFETKLYRPKDCRSEQRGKGQMREASTRIVRTIFDDTNSPDANLVLGEDINFPGKWSSYPPHSHDMPEFYYYRFLPEQGFGFSMLGEDAVQTHHGDTVLIFDEAHSQTAAPGYAMYYIWAIRHLENRRYGPSTNTPVFDPKHLWVTKQENQDKIFPPEKKE